ncbi:hypothetical protein Bca4012_012669 [Brassica carinata]
MDWSIFDRKGEEAGMRRIRWFCLRGKSLGRSFEKKSRGSTSFEGEIDGECCVQEGLQKLSSITPQSWRLMMKYLFNQLFN